MTRIRAGNGCFRLLEAPKFFILAQKPASMRRG